jgi:carbon-monoxide dehydrogenase medium subunit
MIPAPFEFEVAQSVEHAIDLLADYGSDAKLVAGGHSLLPLMRLRLARPSALIDINRIPDLSYIREEGDRIAIGATTRYHDIVNSSLVKDACPILARVSSLVGDPQVRHVGTIGGSVAHGDPASDIPSALLALDAELIVSGPGSARRTVPASDFFKGLFQTDLGPQEMLTEIRIRRPVPDMGWSCLKFSRRAQDWAIVGITALVERSNGRIARARIALTNMGLVPLRASAVEEALTGARPDAVARAAEMAAEGTSPPSDTNASADYRRYLVRLLVRRAVESALLT